MTLHTLAIFSNYQATKVITYKTYTVHNSVISQMPEMKMIKKTTTINSKKYQTENLPVTLNYVAIQNSTHRI